MHKSVARKDYIQQLKAAIKLLHGDIPKPVYSFEVHELQKTPVNYYKNMLLNIVRDIPDELTERRKHCNSSCCSEWHPETCKSCTHYYN